LPWLLILAAYTLLGLLFTSQVWIDYAYARQPLTWWRAAAVALADWYLWALLTPAVVSLSRRFRLNRHHWLGSLVVHIPVSLICAVAKQLADTFIAMAITGYARGPTNFMKVHVSFLTYWAIVGITYSLEHYYKYRERELQTAQLQAALARAQVQSLQMQLHPHFLFNTLNAIAALMREDMEAADVMIVRLGDLLRVTLATADVSEVPLGRELELVDMYLDIQRARMGDRLTTRVSADPEMLDVAVPTLVLQPLVENAIRHGAAARSGPISIDVRAQRDGEFLVVDVEDDGPGPPEAVAPGHGLENTRLRLAAAYGPTAVVQVIPRGGGGTISRVRLPCAR
jgi:two-component system, LytTR family, sensor kinase